MGERVLVACLLLISPAWGGATRRQEVSLNGAWERQFVAELGEPPAGGQWAPCTVPGYFEGVDGRRVWLRRSFDVPEAMRGLRIVIRFGGVKFNSRVYVNGRQVGGCFGGYEPFEVDVTDAVRFGQPNELLVGCHDWTGVFAPGPFELPKDRNWDAVRGAPRDLVLSPIGGLFNLFGIWDDVTLAAHPAVYIQDLFIKPSVRRHELVVDYTIANESAADAEVALSALAEDQGREALRLPESKLTIPAGKTATATLRAAWPNPHLWSHVDPHLYVLKSAIGNRQSAILDEVSTRFGFREFWTEGPDFYLNGSKIHLLATSWWPPHQPMKREEIEKQWKAIKAAGCVAFRTHTQPWPALHYDVADELGLLMIVEGAVWNDDDVYRVNDPAFWDNYAKHLKAMVARDKNRPSVIMWSLENELTGGRVNDNTPFPKAQLVRLGKLVKEWDPTRPITYESDGDPDGVADVIGIHYPHEYPDFTCWPNDAYWLDKPCPGSGGGGIFLNGQKEFLWKRDKPLYIGEFLWVPSSDPSWHTVFFGDDAYKDYRRYSLLAKAESWKMAILAYRHYGVSGMCPWTVIDGPLDDTNPLYRAHQYAYQPIAAYCLDYDRRFYAGEKVARRVEVFNDVLTSSRLAFRWTLMMDGKPIAEGGEVMTLGPAEQRMMTVALPMPQVGRRTPLQWRVMLDREGRRAFDETHEYAVFPRPTLPKLTHRIGLYDPKGATRRLFEAHGFRTEQVESLAKLTSALDVVVVGARAFEARPKEPPTIGRVAPEREALQRFVALGGRLLVLEQAAYPEGLFDLSLSDHRSTMAFPLWPSHPALNGVESDDLKFWRGDHLVTASEPARPASGAALPLVVSGSAAGLDHAPLLERPLGGGYAFFSQLRLAEKFESEPAAARILANLLEHVATRRSATPKTGVLGASEEYLAHLRRLGLRVEDLTGRLDRVLLPSYFVIICRGETDEFAGLRKYVEMGGRLLLHRYPVSAFPRFAREFGLGVELRPYAGPVARAEGPGMLLARGEADVPLPGILAREDLYWLGKHVGISWAETPRASDVADAIVALKIDPARATAYEVRDWHLTGALVERQPTAVIFATNGSASAEIDFPRPGQYLLGLRARGTPCGGVYPVANISVDDKLFGTVSVDSKELTTHSAFGVLTKGIHKVSIAFINDANDPAKGEDRNLVVAKLLVAHHEPDAGRGEEAHSSLGTVLTVPPAVALFHYGRGSFGGTIILDELKWDTEEANARKAARYATTLLTALGGDFVSRPSWAIECETMTPQPGMGWFRADAMAAHLACSGWIKTPIQVAAAGRYTMEVVAAGTPAQKVYPHVEVSLDGKKIGEVQLTTGGWRPYPLAVELPEGQHELSLAFTNDLNVGGEDRNLSLDKVVFYKE